MCEGGTQSWVVSRLEYLLGDGNHWAGTSLFFAFAFILLPNSHPPFLFISAVIVLSSALQPGSAAG